MAKTILIPIDFKVQSLNTLKLALADSQADDVTVILVYPETLSDSITELMFYSPGKRIRALTGAEFKKALDILVNRFERQVSDIRIELLHAPHRQFLLNFLKAHRISEIYVPKRYQLSPGANGFDPIPGLKKSGLPVYEMDWEPGSAGSVNELNALFR